MRQFIRHPSHIPLLYRRVENEDFHKDHMKDISQGGLCFFANDKIETGWNIEIEIPVSHPAFKATGTVVWCRNVHGKHEVGVQFADIETEFAVRLVEQICHIEEYRTEVRLREGRLLSSEDAAREWIRTRAEEFPR